MEAASRAAAEPARQGAALPARAVAETRSLPRRPPLPNLCRQLAEIQGVSKSTIDNICQAHHLQPHRVQTFKPSRHAKEALSSFYSAHTFALPGGAISNGWFHTPLLAKASHQLLRTEPSGPTQKTSSWF